MCFEYFFIKKKIKNLCRRIFSNSEKILDLGCGTKPYYHKSINARIIGGDIVATKKTHVVFNAMKLPFKNSSFDGIMCVNSLYYYPNPFEAVKEMSRVTKRGGKVILVTPFMYPIHDTPSDKYRFTEYGLRELLQKDFRIKKIVPVGGIFNQIPVFFHSLIKGVPLLFPKFLRPLMKLLMIPLYPFYIAAQFVSLFDVFDKTRRWPTYYFTVARKK